MRSARRSASGLARTGPLVSVRIAPSRRTIANFARCDIAWDPVEHEMMIDTGAEVTVVEAFVPLFLNLAVPRLGGIEGVTGALDCNVYRLGITVGGEDRSGAPCEISFETDVYTMPPASDVARPHIGLLGRDFLRMVRLDYDGRTGVVRLIDESR